MHSKSAAKLVDVQIVTTERSVASMVTLFEAKVDPLNYSAGLLVNFELLASWRFGAAVTEGVMVHARGIVNRRRC